MFWVIWNILFFQFEDRLYTSESDVYRRQNLKYKDGPRAERKGGIGVWIPKTETDT